MEDEKTKVETKEQEPEWLAAPEASDADQQPGTIPAVAHLKIKQKLQARVNDRDQEIEQLKQEIAQMKQQTAVSAPAPIAPHTTLERPKRADFDDDDAYYAAVDQYMDKSVESRFSRVQAQQQQNQAAESLNRIVDDHYQRVDKLLAESGLSEDVYLDSHRKIEDAISIALRTNGKPVLDQFISSLGDGSEKAVVYVGRNQTALDRFTRLLQEDPSGLKAATYLGAETQRLKNAARPKPGAPAPSTEIPGGDATVVDEGTLKKRYEAAQKKGDINGSINAKLDARRAGMDVSGW